MSFRKTLVAIFFVSSATQIAVAQTNSCDCSAVSDPGQRAACIKRCPAPPLPTPTGGQVYVPEDMRKRVKEIVLQQQLKSQKPRRSWEISIGGAIPPDIELAPLPSELVESNPSWRGFKYFYTGEDVVIVDPSSNKVDMIIR